MHHNSDGEQSRAATVLQSWWRGLATRAALASVRVQYQQLVQEVEEQEQVPVFYCSDKVTCIPELYQPTKQRKVLPTQQPGSLQPAVVTPECPACTCGTTKSTGSVAGDRTHQETTSTTPALYDGADHAHDRVVADTHSGKGMRAEPKVDQQRTTPQQDAGCKKDASTATDTMQKHSSRGAAGIVGGSEGDSTRILPETVTTVDQDVNTGDSLLEPLKTNGSFVSSSRDMDEPSEKSHVGQGVSPLNDMLEHDLAERDSGVRESKLSEFTNVSSCNFSDMTSTWDKDATKGDHSARMPGSHHGQSFLENLPPHNARDSHSDSSERDMSRHSKYSDRSQPSGDELEAVMARSRDPEGDDSQLEATSLKSQSTDRDTGKNIEKLPLKSKAGPTGRHETGSIAGHTGDSTEKQLQGTQRKVPKENERKQHLPQAHVKSKAAPQAASATTQKVKSLSEEERAALEEERQALVMELLWVQQAIASRKQYLQLKQGLVTGAAKPT